MIAHLHEKDNFREAAWISRLINDGKKPIMVVLTRCETANEAHDREYEIMDEYLEMGCDLYNRHLNKRLHIGVSNKTYKEIQRRLVEENTTISKLVSRLICEPSDLVLKRADVFLKKIEPTTCSAVGMIVISREVFIYSLKCTEAITKSLYEKASRWLHCFNYGQLRKLHESLVTTAASYDESLACSAQDYLDRQILDSLQQSKRFVDDMKKRVEDILLS
jgi:hypothetical protein